LVLVENRETNMDPKAAVGVLMLVPSIIHAKFQTQP
jgi:hypothetical protein